VLHRFHQEVHALRRVLLRAVLRSDSQPEISLREEIDLTRSYVELEQMRFGDRMAAAPQLLAVLDRLESTPSAPRR